MFLLLTITGVPHFTLFCPLPRSPGPRRFELVHNLSKLFILLIILIKWENKIAVILGSNRVSSFVFDRHKVLNKSHFYLLTTRRFVYHPFNTFPVLLFLFHFLSLILSNYYNFITLPLIPYPLSISFLLFFLPLMSEVELTFLSAVNCLVLIKY